MADVSLPSGPVMTELEKNPTLEILKVSLEFSASFRRYICHCFINCVYYILTVFQAT